MYKRNLFYTSTVLIVIKCKRYIERPKENSFRIKNKKKRNKIERNTYNKNIHLLNYIYFKLITIKIFKKIFLFMY